MATTLLPSSIEGFMGLREKHPVYSKLSILFFNEDPLLILSNLGILRNINGMVLCATLLLLRCEM